MGNSSGSEYHPNLNVSYIDVHVKKGQHNAAYSAFEGVDFDSRTLEEIFERLGITHVEVCGIALDYCVAQTAIDAAKLGYKVDVIVDLTAAVGGETAVEPAMNDLAKYGIGWAMSA